MPNTEDSPNPPSRFLEVAMSLVRRGFKLTPLEGKRPVLKDWKRSCSDDPEQLKKWSQERPHANCGVVTHEQPYWVLDVDHLDWFMERVPEPPKTYSVRTGSGKLHIYFKGRRPDGLRGIPNPVFKSKEETPSEPAKLIEFPDQVVGEGSVHPETGRAYKALNDTAVAECPASFLDWLKSLPAMSKAPASLRPRPLRPELTLERLLDRTELKGKYERFDAGDRVFLNYHSLLGKCLLKGSPHHGTAGLEEKNRQCGFYYMKANPADWGHQCFSCGCGGRSDALKALGVDPDEVLRPAWRELFRSRDELSSAKLEFIVETFMPEEGITGLAGWSGHGKTWVMMSIAKAVASGSQLWGRFTTKKTPVLYLIPEAGDRSFRRRMDLMRVPSSEDFLVRTLSQGPAPKLLDPLIREAAKGRLVVMDTFPRWLDGRDEKNSSEMAELNEEMNALIRAGSPAVLFAQHSVKLFEKATVISGADAFRGSGDIYANMSAGHVVVQLDEDKSKTLLHIECVKPRDFEPLGPFQLEGKPWIDEEGDFRLVKPPGECGWLRDEKARLQKRVAIAGGLTQEEWAMVEQHLGRRKSVRQIAEETGIGRNRITKELNRRKNAQRRLDGEDEPEF